MAIKPTKRKDSPYWWIRGTYRKRSVYKSTGILHADRKTPPEKIWDIIRAVENTVDNETIYGIHNTTFAKATENYLKRGGSPRFLEKIVEAIGGESMHSLTFERLEEVADTLYEGCTNQTINRQFVTPVNAVFNANKIPPVLSKRKVTTKKRASINKALLYEDAVSVLNALPLNPAEIMFFLFYTGMRPIEAITLQPEDVNLNDRWIVLKLVLPSLFDCLCDVHSPNLHGL